MSPRPGGGDTPGPRFDSMVVQILGPLVDLGSMLHRDQHMDTIPKFDLLSGTARNSSDQVPYADAGSLAILSEIMAQTMLVHSICCPSLCNMAVDVSPNSQS